MISLAILGVLQALFIPGFLISSATSRYTKLPLVDNLLIATPLSMVMNYLLVSILEMNHVYTQPVMLMVVGVEIVVLLIVLSRQLSPNIHMDTTRGVQIKKTFSNMNYLAMFFNVLALCMLIAMYKASAGSVFEVWDVVVSWNRWAKETFDQTRGGTFGYPPGVPILYSLIYKLAGTTNLQTISKLVASYFPFFGLFCFWRLGRLRVQFALASSLASVIFVYLIGASFYGRVSFVFSGMVDPIMAVLGVFVLYALCISTECSKSEFTGQARKYVVALLTIAVSSIAIVKQSGVPVALLFAVIIAYSFRRDIAKEKGYWVGLALLFGLLVTNYYILSYVYWNDYVRADSLIPGQVFLRPITAFKLLLTSTGYGIWFLVLGALFIDRSSRGVFLFLVAPLYLFWAFFVSYDIRTAYVFFPWLAMLAGIALAKIAGMGKTGLLIFFLVSYILFREAYWLHPEINHPAHPKWFHPEWIVPIFLMYVVVELLSKDFATKFKFCSVRCSAFFLMGVITLGLIVLPLFESSDTLLAENTLKRTQSNDVGFNEKLSMLFEQEPEARMISCWQVIYNIPASEGRFFPVACGNDMVAMWIEKPDIKYFLYWSWFNKYSLQQTREQLTLKGISFTEEKLAEEYSLFKRE